MPPLPDREISGALLTSKRFFFLRSPSSRLLPFPAHSRPPCASLSPALFCGLHLCNLPHELIPAPLTLFTPFIHFCSFGLSPFLCIPCSRFIARVFFAHEGRERVTSPPSPYLPFYPGLSPPSPKSPTFVVFIGDCSTTSFFFFFLMANTFDHPTSPFPQTPS